MGLEVVGEKTEHGVEEWGVWVAAEGGHLVEEGEGGADEVGMEAEVEDDLEGSERDRDGVPTIGVEEEDESFGVDAEAEGVRGGGGGEGGVAVGTVKAGPDEEAEGWDGKRRDGVEDGLDGGGGEREWGLREGELKIRV